MRRLLVLILAVGFGALGLGGCSSYREALNRGQRLYEENEYDRAVGIFRYLEADMDSLSPADQARYCYLRGMTDYRLSSGEEKEQAQFRPYARHWLALAKALEDQNPGLLLPEWKQRLEEALDELNRKVWGIGATETAS